MSNTELLDNIKKLREMTGVGFKDCKIALDETGSDIEKSILHRHQILVVKNVGGRMRELSHYDRLRLTIWLNLSPEGLGHRHLLPPLQHSP